jgi:ribosomal protein S18 acetylase RimI-like enzyme
VTASLGFATDLALRRAEGAQVLRRTGATVVRTAENPGFRWGNFLLVPEAGDPATRAAEHAAALPGAAFTTIGIDDAHPALDEDAWRAAGFEVERLAVLTREGAPAADRRGVRVLSSDADWAAEAAIALELEPAPDAAHDAFARQRTASRRRAVEDGRLLWAGVEQDGEIVATAGIGDAGDGVARFQDVQTRMAHRRRGHATALVAGLAAAAVDAFGSTRLVIVAERDGPAIGVYLRLGFREAEEQVQLSRIDPA